MITEQFLQTTARPFLFFQAYRLTHGDRDAAQDLTQDTIVKIWRMKDRFNPNKPRGAGDTRPNDPEQLFKTWAKSILVNRYRDLLRLKKNQEVAFTRAEDRGIPVLTIAEEEGYYLHYADTIDALPADTQDEFKMWLGTLTPRQMQVCRMLISGQDQADIARELGVRPQSIKDVVGSIRRSFAGYLLSTRGDNAPDSAKLFVK